MMKKQFLFPNRQQLFIRVTRHSISGMQYSIFNHAVDIINKFYHFFISQNYNCCLQNTSDSSEKHQRHRGPHTPPESRPYTPSTQSSPDHPYLNRVNLEPRTPPGPRPHTPLDPGPRTPPGPGPRTPPGPGPRTPPGTPPDSDSDEIHELEERRGGRDIRNQASYTETRPPRRRDQRSIYCSFILYKVTLLKAFWLSNKRCFTIIYMIVGKGYQMILRLLHPGSWI